MKIDPKLVAYLDIGMSCEDWDYVAEVLSDSHSPACIALTKAIQAGLTKVGYKESK